MKVVHKPRSGQLIAKNDVYIDLLLEDPLYDIREDGTIWSRRTLQGHVGNDWRPVGRAKPRGVTGKPYVSFRYQVGGISKWLSGHRIVYRKFNGPLAEDLVINHIDGNTLNNVPSNLELETQSKNNEHRFRVLKNPAVLGNRKMTNEQILEIRELQKAGWTNRQLREKFGLSKSTISYIVNNRTFKDLEGSSTVVSLAQPEPENDDTQKTDHKKKSNS